MNVREDGGSTSEVLSGKGRSWDKLEVQIETQLPSTGP